MALDSEKDPLQEMREEMRAKEREQYAKDPSVWLHKSFAATRHEVHEQVKWHSEQQEEQTKSFLQALADSHRRYLSSLEARLILWLGIIAIIVSASAGLFGIRDGLVVGAIIVGLVVIGRVYLWKWLLRKRINRLDRFRNRFRKLLENVDDVRWQTGSAETRATDKAFLEKYKDSILSPSTVSDFGGDGIPSDSDLAHIETLYAEYGPTWRHLHPWPDPNDPNSNTKLKCELCMGADRVRKHIDGAISAYEAAIASARQLLVSRIDKANPDGAVDAKVFLDEYSKHKGMYYVPEDLANEDVTLLARLNSLCDKQRWTFAETDKVRELCRLRAKGESHWLESYEQNDRFDDVVGKLRQEMKSAASRCGLADTWDWYDTAKERLALTEGVIKVVRRILGRHSPAAMFRELQEEFGPFEDIASANRLPGITNWGYDRKFVVKERKAATRLISKERDKYDRERDRELRAMQAFVRTEHRARE